MSQAVPARPRGPSGAQLALTILAVLLALSAIALVQLGLKRRLFGPFPAYAVLFVAGYLAAHALIRRFAPRADPAFLPAAALLTGLGFAMVYRLDPHEAAQQANWLILGLVAFGVTLFVVRDHRELNAYTYTIGLAGVGLLLLPILPGIGREINGARVWIGLGPLSFQPSELGKVLIAVFLASYLNQKRELLQMATGKLGPFHVPQIKHLGPVLVAWGVSLAVLFLEKDIGTSLLFFGIFVVMLWVATGRAAYVVIGALLFVVGALFAFSTFGHVKERVIVWQHALDVRPCPSTAFPHKPCVQAEGFQLAQAEFSLATGGIGGVDLGRGQPGTIPFASTDFVFAALGEELGLLGTVGLLLLYVVLVGKGFKTALEREDAFGKLLAAGLTTIIGLQTFIIVGGVTRLIPLTGQTLPFVSYGGSSLLSNFILLGLLARISSGPEPRRRPAVHTRAARAAA